MHSRLVVLCSFIAAVAGCGDFVESSDTLGLATVDTKGGTLHLQALTVEVPASAVGQAVTLRATETIAAGALAAAYLVEPAGLQFSTAITVRFSLDGLSLPPSAEVFLVDFAHRPPQPLHNRHAGGHEISGTTTTTGTFGLIRCPGGTCPQ